MTAVSLFSGCGGFDLGFHRAGFLNLWMNEFNMTACASLRANYPHAIVERGDISQVRTADILARTGLGAGALDVLFGGWPCQPFSSAGPRSRKWNGVIEKLFMEFVRVAAGLRPIVAVGENVAGMRQGASVGWLKAFEREMGRIGYRVAMKELNAADYGVASERQRLIFVCVRGDYPTAGSDPATWFPAPRASRLGVSDVLPWVTETEFYNRRPGNRRAHLPAPTICASAQQWSGGTAADGSVREFTIGELKLLCGFPAAYRLAGSEVAQRRQIGNSVPPPFAFAIASTVGDLLRKGQ